MRSRPPSAQVQRAAYVIAYTTVDEAVKQTSTAQRRVVPYDGMPRLAVPCGAMPCSAAHCFRMLRKVLSCLDMFICCPVMSLYVSARPVRLYPFVCTSVRPTAP